MELACQCFRLSLLQGIGDMNLAYQCFRLALSANNDHSEAYNNLGVLEMRKGHAEMVTSATIYSHAHVSFQQSRLCCVVHRASG